MPAGGRITISATEVSLSETDVTGHPGSEPGQYVRLTVTDTGTGIPEAIRSKIFDPFFTTKDIGKGTGLGLATVSSIVQKHKGFIDLVSKVSRGTEFRIYLPVSTQEEVAVGQEDIPALPRGNGEGILVVDDEMSVVHIARETLEAYNYRVYTAVDGVEATLLFERDLRGSVNLVISDINMPRMDGLDMARILRSNDPHVKILITSGSPAETEARKAEIAKYEFLAKPYTADQLLRAIDDLLKPG
jgi:CheY-like chemotaxis protein